MFHDDSHIPTHWGVCDDSHLPPDGGRCLAALTHPTTACPPPVKEGCDGGDGVDGGCVAILVDMSMVAQTLLMGCCGVRMGIADVCSSCRLTFFKLFFIFKKQSVSSCACERCVGWWCSYGAHRCVFELQANFFRIIFHLKKAKCVELCM